MPLWLDGALLLAALIGLIWLGMRMTMKENKKVRITGMILLGILAGVAAIYLLLAAIFLMAV